MAIAPTVEAVDALQSEDEQLLFIKAFRNLMRTMNVLKTFSHFSWSDLWMTEQTFEDYKSKYLDLYDKVRAEKEEAEKVSILEEVDFELELIQRDEINVAYILALLAQIKEAENSENEEEREAAANRKQAVLDLLGSEAQLRSKRELIEKFISDYLPAIATADAVETGFDDFWNEQREKQVDEFCEREALNREAVEEMIRQYHFTHRPPLREKIVAALETKPKILERKSIIERVSKRLMELITTFDDR